MPSQSPTLFNWTSRAESSGKELLVHLEAGAGGGNVQEQKKRVCGVGRVLHSDCIYSFSVKVGKGVDKISFFPELQ